MKRYLLLCMMAFLTLAASAQNVVPTTLEGWAERVQKFGKSVPQEQVFIHMDNTCYFLGDTIFFKAYVRRSDTGAPSKLSGVLYAELLNQDGYLVTRQQLELKNGQAHGSFALFDTLYGGYYELRAYTRWQLNWGEYQHAHTKFAEEYFLNASFAKDYYRDYEKLYSRVFPVYDKPLTPGDYTRDMTLRPMTRYFKADNTPLKGYIQLYPEGGHLVAGVVNRVAFEANNEEGKHLEGTVIVTDDKGAKVAETKTEQRGRGSVEFTPQSGTKYQAEFTWKNGTAKEALPEVEDDGMALRIEQKDGQVTINMAAAGSAASEPLGMTIMNQGNMLDFQELPAGTSQTITKQVEKLRDGVCQVTVFNAQGRILADRLFFVMPADMQVNQLTFGGIQEKPYQAFDPISISVKGGRPGSEISLAVRDAAHSEYLNDNANMLTEALLSSQIKGFVEDPSYFFEKNDAEHLRALDLLLWIQGWRRYSWHEMATPGAFVLKHMPEATPLLTGCVQNYRAELAENSLDKTVQAEHEEAMMTDEERTALDGDKYDNGTVTSDGDITKDFEAMRTESRFNGNGNTNRVSERDVRERHKYVSNLKRDVVVHAEFTKPGAKDGESGIVGDVLTQGGVFNIQTPRFFNICSLFLAASDSTKWKDGKEPEWISVGEDSRGEPIYADFYLKLNPIYPRFVKPYSYYQTALADAPKGSVLEGVLPDGTRVLDEVTVGARRNGRRKFDPSKPAFVISARQAFNDVCDAGFLPGYYRGLSLFSTYIARNYIGDMNMNRNYDMDIRLDGKHISDSQDGSRQISQGEEQKYNQLSRLDKVAIYTDYSPRREGDKHYEQSNQPTVTINLFMEPNDGLNMTYRDRYYPLEGFAVCEDFYHPNYAQKPLPETKDYRRTLYWNPSLLLDDSGAAEVQFYNNSKPTQIAVSAEGMAPDGTPLTGLDMPETRK